MVIMAIPTMFTTATMVMTIMATMVTITMAKIRTKQRKDIKKLRKSMLKRTRNGESSKKPTERSINMEKINMVTLVSLNINYTFFKYHFREVTITITAMATRLKKTLITSLSMFLSQLCPPGSLLMHLPRLKNNFKSREFSRTNIVKIIDYFYACFLQENKSDNFVLFNFSFIFVWQRKRVKS